MPRHKFICSIPCWFERFDSLSAAIGKLEFQQFIEGNVLIKDSYSDLPRNQKTVLFSFKRGGLKGVTLEDIRRHAYQDKISHLAETRQNTITHLGIYVKNALYTFVQAEL